ncbi:MAG: aspartate-semialdehyde dehydrogenase [Defluviitaleaceae bacterium]|nr:aspartate-semialdehyde dehydrogenase [Defluviitaleaceae bacterium]
MKEVNLALVGAGGLVGLQFLKVLEQREREGGYNVKALYLFASPASSGKKLNFKGKEYTVESIAENSFDKDIDYAFFCADNETSEKYAPIATKKGIVVIDNSSHFRMKEDVPLVVPEVNPNALKNHKNIIANPNCTTIQATVVLAPLHRTYGLKRVVISTYQAVSGAGKDGLSDLLTGIAKLSWQTQRINDTLLEPDHVKNTVDILNPYHHYELKAFPDYIANNVLPTIGDITENGYTTEEMKIMNETKKILGLPNLPITATAVRIPIIHGHSESVNIVLEKEYQLNDLIKLLDSSPGVAVTDTPMPIKTNGKDTVFVGRIRQDFSTNGVNMFIVADNLRKGAATNGVQIMEALL